MGKILRKLLPYLTIYLAAVFLGIVLLFAVSKIPQNKLTENWREARNTNFADTAFHYVMVGEYGTYVDDYTNNMKMLIAYSLNEQSILSPAGYIEEADFSYDYGRYWHGYSVLLRPLLIFFNMSQIQIVYNLLLIVIFACLLFQLIKRKEYLFIVSLAVSFYLTNMWMCFMDLQHFNCTFISVLACNVVLKFPEATDKYKGYIFYLIGILVQYFDFLTFETLTLSLPLICLLLISEKTVSMWGNVKKIIVACLAWLSGYSMMFVAKCLAYIYEKGTVALDMLSYKLAERITGSNVAQEYTIKDTLMVNFFCIRGMTFKNIPYMVGVLTAMILLYIYFVHGIPDFNVSLAMLLVALIPLMRLIIVREHSATHAPFAYHALFSSVIAITYMVILCIYKSCVLFKLKRRNEYEKNY